MPDNNSLPRDNERSLEEVVGALDGAAIVVHDFDGIVSRWTSGCEQLYGWTSSEAVGRVVHDLLATEFPSPLEGIREQVRVSGVWNGELTHRHKEGHRVYVASRWTRPAGQASLRSAIVETNHDITDLRAAQQELLAREALLRSILDTVPESMIIIDEGGVITSFSATAVKLFGYEPSELTGQNVKVLMPLPDREEHDGHIARYLATGERSVIGKRRVVIGQRRDGSTFPMEMFVGETSANGRRIFTGFIRDLTSRHKMEADLRQAQKMEAIGQLTGGLAHDFNNLLTVILGNLEMLEPHLVGDRQQLLLAEARAAADDGATLTGQLLAFGRRQPLHAQLTDIGSLVSGFSELLRRTMGEAVELRTVISGASNRAHVDASQLQNALLNLALNSRDAMPRGGCLTIEISQIKVGTASQSDPEIQPGPYVLISVNDTGEGMSAEVQQRAFEPFFTTKQSGLGTGLGLSMVYGFVKQSGGHVQIQSELGRGTSIRLFLPAATRAEPVSEAERSTAAVGRRAFANGETILVVEDNPRVRRVAVARLTAAGYTIVEAATGAEALVQLAAHPETKLVFTDVVMPGGMSGDQLARDIRMRRPDVHILFTSGYTEPTVAGREQAIAANWLRKPYTARDLVIKIQELLRPRP